MHFRKFQKSIAYLLLICLLPVLSGCSYYRKKSELKNVTNVLEVGQNYIGKDYTFFIHVGDQITELSDVVLDQYQNLILGQATGLDFQKAAQYKMMESNNLVRFKGAEKKNAKQVHVFAATYEDIGDGRIKVYGDELDRVEVYGLDGLVTTLSFLGTASLTYVTAIAIALLILCNCPHVYAWDGAQFAFASTLFTGAVNQNLQRSDFKKMPDFFPGSNKLDLKIINEDYEKQFIDQLELISIEHDHGSTAYINQRGEIIIVDDEIQPGNVITSNQNKVQISELIQFKDDLVFDFDFIDEEGFSNLKLDFDKVTDTERAFVIMRIKNSKWGSMAYKEFVSLFGHKYDDWVDRTNGRQRSNAEQWIKDQKLNLQVEQRINGKWKLIEEINMIGDDAFNELFVELMPAKSIEVRFRTGYKFWDVDYVAITDQAVEATEVNHHKPSTDGVSWTDRELSSVDGTYVSFLRKGEFINVSFNDLPTVKEARSLFLMGEGYYVSDFTFNTRPKYGKLLTFRKPGALSRYSHEMFRLLDESIEVSYGTY